MSQQNETPADKRNNSAQVVVITPIEGVLERRGVCVCPAGWQAGEAGPRPGSAWRCVTGCWVKGCDSESCISHMGQAQLD